MQVPETDSEPVGLGAEALYGIPLQRLNGEADSLANYAGEVILAVNVASKCGKTPQYAGLQALFERYRTQGFTVLAFPCNQFGLEEPGTAEEIEAFCQVNYGVTFPMFAKLEVNGDDRHPLYAVLTAHPDDDGKSGDVAWNFEKFLIARDGRVIRRFRPPVVPEDDEVVRAIESSLKD
jgi:glutathione peroxidase